MMHSETKNKLGTFAAYALPFLIMAAIAVFLLFAGASCAPDPSANVDYNHDGQVDNEETAWAWGEWLGSFAQYFVPGGGFLGAAIFAMRQARYAGKLEQASALQYQQTDRLLEQLPKTQQPQVKLQLRTEQEAEGLRDHIIGAKEKQARV